LVFRKAQEQLYLDFDL